MYVYKHMHVYIRVLVHIFSVHIVFSQRVDVVAAKRHQLLG